MSSFLSDITAIAIIEFYRCHKKYYKRKAASLRMRLNAGLRKSDSPFFGIAVLLLINRKKERRLYTRLVRKESIR